MPGNQQQITLTEDDFVNDPDIGNSRRMTQKINGVLVSTSLRSGDGYLAKSIHHLAGNSVSRSTRSVADDGAWTMTQISPDGTKTIATYAKGQMTRQERFTTGNVSLGFTTMDYDAFDRQTTSTDGRTGMTTMGAYLETAASPR